MTNHQFFIVFHKEACSKEWMYKAQAPYALVIAITEYFDSSGVFLNPP
jgi:hypothetical protein